MLVCGNKISSIPTFDWISLQIYEGWSRTDNAVATNNVPFETYIEELVRKMQDGWSVLFDHSLGGPRMISVPSDRLVIGLANGWTIPFPPPQKFVFIKPQSIARAWNRVKFGGFMFWSITEEGSDVDDKPFLPD